MAKTLDDNLILSRRDVQNILSPEWKKMMFDKKHYSVKILDRELVTDLRGQRNMFISVYDNLIKNVYLKNNLDLTKELKILNHIVTELEEKLMRVSEFKSQNEYVLKVNKWSKNKK